ncbi:MAG: hypothetical protein AAGC74_12055 [Verrucomicrobiota bacterium]
MKIAPLLLLLPTLACAESRTSTNYTLIQETTTNSYGQRSISTNYTLDDSGHGGSVAASTNYTHRDGFAGQLLDPESLAMTATPDPVDEESPTQISTTLVYDDGTTQPNVTPNYTPASGPVSSVSVTGLAQTEAVYQNTTASIEANLSGLTGTITFTVANTNPDNYQEYSSDGLPDDWQITHFGLPPNSNAGPTQNPDGDPQDNLFEYLTGYDPNDPNDFFTFEITGRSGTTANFTASKLIPDTLYTLNRSPDLGQNNPWLPIQTISVTSETNNAPFADNTAPNTPNAKAFYQIEVSSP